MAVDRIGTVIIRMDSCWLYKVCHSSQDLNTANGPCPYWDLVEDEQHLQSLDHNIARQLTETCM